ncbi:MAG TPA: hypothetical protein ENF92_09035 [Desulfobacteraceae bacterium]|nr:hypothetical protein [Desulfobacteraceae bacterium]
MDLLWPGISVIKEAYMIDLSSIDYSDLDQPEVLMFLFHPRPEWGSPPKNSKDLMIPVEDGVRIGARFHQANQDTPNILFFHGNGEIVADYTAGVMGNSHLCYSL